MRSWRSRRSLKVSYTQTSVPCGTLNYYVFVKRQIGADILEDAKVQKGIVQLPETVLSPC